MKKVIQNSTGSTPVWLVRRQGFWGIRPIERGSVPALETWLLHECKIRNAVSGQQRGLYYYASASGGEVDLIIEKRRPTASAPARVVTVEIKLSEKWDRKWERASRSLSASHRVEVERMIGVYAGTKSYSFDGFDVMPALQFVKDLQAGMIF